MRIIKLLSLSLFFLLLGLENLAFAQNTNLLQNVWNRQVTSLDGDWHAVADPYGHGNWSFWKDTPFTGETLQDYDFATSSTLTVPGDWNTQYERYYLYEGKMWYCRHFDYELNSGRCLFLHFDAANYKAKVWLNGKLIGTHEGGYTPFEFDVTDKVSAKNNSLVVCVDNTRLPDGIPTMNTDWWNYGGLTRSVCLVETGSTFIQDYALSISDASKPLISGFVQLGGSDIEGRRVTVSIPELRGASITVSTDAEGRAQFSFGRKIKPQLWDTRNPKLYNVTLSFNDETLLDQIGFRTIATCGDKILLNGKPIFCAGVNVHEESVGTNHRCVSAQEDSMLLQMALDLGCNMVRLAHYPHNEMMVRMADRMGLLVWSEIPLYWGIDWKNERTYELAVQQLSEMISRDHNRSSVVFWSIANETAVNPDRTRFLTRLANEARRQDSTRLICAALQNMCKQIRPNVMTVEDPLHEALDVFSFNEYIGWYDGPKEWCDSLTWQLPQQKPIIISEFGAGARIGRHGSANNYFTEEMMVAIYEHQFNMLNRIEGLAGTIPWVLKDFRSPHRLLPGVQDDYNRKGLYSDQGEKKDAFRVVKEWNIRKTSVDRK